MNKMTIFVVCTLFSSFSYATFPTIAELCTAGAELFCCRASRPGTEIFPSLGGHRLQLSGKLGEVDAHAINLKYFTHTEKEEALARYEKVLHCGLYTRQDIEQGRVKGSILSKKTRDLAVAYKASKMAE